MARLRAIARRFINRSTLEREMDEEFNSHIQLRTDDLATTFDKLASSPGVEVLQEPTDQFWGVRDAAVRDPSGNLIRIAQA